MMKEVRFNDALRIAAQATQDSSLPSTWEVRIIRDVYGRIRFAVNSESSEYPSEALKKLKIAQQSLGAFATNDDVLFRDSFSNPDTVFSSTDWHRTNVWLGADEDGNSAGEVQVSVLDRQITGQDWLRPQTSSVAHPHRLVFFGLKGGVGRSTALMMVAWGLARKGKRVLLVDFDLESPGLSGLLLPPGNAAEFGIVDWLVESAVGQGENVLRSMVSASPLGETTTGAIRVAAAMGSGEADYLAKLARAYADVPSAKGAMRIGTRMRELLELLEAQERPDVVLIDSRAGLHDLAAVSITSLADTALLFATDSAQTWMGYRQLFTYWQRRPEVVTHVRERLAIVRALTPKSDRERIVVNFQEESYALFAETIYDDIPPNVDEQGADDFVFFHPSENDESAPHFPILVDWDERFQEFDPHLRPEQGGITEVQVDATFGNLLRWVEVRTSESE